MKVNLTVKVQLANAPHKMVQPHSSSVSPSQGMIAPAVPHAVVSFAVMFDHDYGSYEYDWKVNRVSIGGRLENFDHMEVKTKVQIENAIEEVLYKFPFENYLY